MKKIIRVSLLVMLMAVLILGTVPLISKGVLPGVQPLVGWNTGVSREMPEAVPVAWIVLPPFPMPNVGWNTGVSWEAPEAEPVAYFAGPGTIQPYSIGWNT